MLVPTLVFSSGRRLMFQLPANWPSESLHRPFATLLTAFNDEERREAEAVVPVLMGQGCVEFCCVGPEAALLHDSVDEIVETKGALDILTTWHTDAFEAVEYFLFAAAGGKPSDLLALVAAHPDLVELLRKEAGSD